MTKCTSCGFQNHNTLFIVDNKKIIKCKKCGLVRTLNKTNINYKKYHRDDDYNKHQILFKNIFRKRFNIITKFKPKGRILDIGASTGIMLEIFKKNNWEVWGVEPSNAGSTAKQKEIKIIKSTFEKAKLPKNYFDVVIINHVLEHTNNPIQFLIKAKTVLKKDGIIYVDVPNFDSLISKIRGKHWKYLSPDEHLYHFTPKTLKNILIKSGFEIVWEKTNSGIFDVASPIAKLTYELKYLRRNFILDILRIPLDVVSQITNRGASLAMIGKKK